MKLIIAIAMFILPSISKAQFDNCDRNPMPSKIDNDTAKNPTSTFFFKLDSIQLLREGLTKNQIDSVRKAKWNMQVKLAPLKVKLKTLQREIIALPNSDIVDSVADYKMLFYETNSWNAPYGKLGSDYYDIQQKDSIVNIPTLRAKYKDRYNKVSFYAYGNNYLIMLVCDVYIGNSSWGSTQVFYLKKVN